MMYTDMNMQLTTICDDTNECLDLCLQEHTMFHATRECVQSVLYASKGPRLSA